MSIDDILVWIFLSDLLINHELNPLWYRYVHSGIVLEVMYLQFNLKWHIYTKRSILSLPSPLFDWKIISLFFWLYCLEMKKDFIVSKIEASQDGSPYVYVAFHDANIESKTTTTTSGGGKNFPQSPFGSSNNSSDSGGGNSSDAVPPFFTSPEDLMKNLPKAMSNIFGGGGSVGMSGDFPTFKISMREYEDIQLKVGDKVTIDIKKADSSSGI